jgi:hypothetical protein
VGPMGPCLTVLMLSRAEGPLAQPLGLLVSGPMRTGAAHQKVLERWLACAEPWPGSHESLLTHPGYRGFPEAYWLMRDATQCERDPAPRRTASGPQPAWVLAQGWGVQCTRGIPGSWSARNAHWLSRQAQDPCLPVHKAAWSRSKHWREQPRTPADQSGS